MAFTFRPGRRHHSFTSSPEPTQFTWWEGSSFCSTRASVPCCIVPSNKGGSWSRSQPGTGTSWGFCGCISLRCCSSGDEVGHRIYSKLRGGRGSVLFPHGYNFHFSMKVLGRTH